MSKLIFFDIDGTLAKGIDVPESAQKAIDETRKKGNKVVICSGRAVSYIEHYFSDYADGYIGFNGRMAIYQGKTIFDEPIDGGLIDHIVDVLRHDHLGFTLFNEDHGYFEGNDQTFEEIIRFWTPGFMVKGIPDHLKVYGLDIFYQQESQFEKADQALPECIFNKHTPHLSADTSFADCDKGSAIRRIASTLKVDLHDTYAFGDGYNDVVMLKAAGHGIAMGNGVKEAKKAAEYITDDIDHDGVRNGLKYYELI